MSVLKSKRKVSRLEFLHNAYAIQRNLVLLLLRDFGLKTKVRTVKAFSDIYKMTEEDREHMVELMDKYGITSITEEYPEWLISDMRNRVLYEARALVRNIIQANSIYPHTRGEFEDRRRYQTMAIGNCEQLIQELQYVISIVKVDANKFLPYVDMIDREVALLRGWRKSDNRLLTKIKENERQEATKELLATEALANALKHQKQIDVKQESFETNNASEHALKSTTNCCSNYGNENDPQIINDATGITDKLSDRINLSETESLESEIITGSISKVPLEVLKMELTQ